MGLENRIGAFIELGNFLRQFKDNVKEKSLITLNEQFYDDFEDLIARQKRFNGWFSKENVLEAVNSIGNSLREKAIRNWLKSYSLTTDKPTKKIGVVMAGNIPMVGFHDLLCVLITGNTLMAKLASDDNQLLRKVAEILLFLDPIFNDKIHFVEKLQNFDAVIATGSNNTARYFEYYFKKYPHIIRNNRNAVGIIHENDTKEELNKLGKDIFLYYGLGCRSVSKVYFPTNYNIAYFFEAIFSDYQHVVENNKYANNYDYNKAIYLMDNDNKLLDNGFLLLKEDKQLSSPVGVLNYEFYDSVSMLKNVLKEKEEEIQCTVASNRISLPSLSFGEAQSPNLSDYADGVDTIQFLTTLS